jgi:hypothetical protein
LKGYFLFAPKEKRRVDKMKNVQSIHLMRANEFRIWKSNDQLDKNIDRIWKRVHMNKTEQEILTFISQRSFGVLGTSWWKVKNIAEKVKKSVRMVGYALTSLEEKGVIRRVPVMKKSGGNSSNIIVILPYCRPWIADRGGYSITDVSKGRSQEQGTETTIYELKQDNINVPTEKLFKLFSWKIKDKKIKYGSSYVEKAINTLFEYAQTLIESEERQQRMKEILATHAMAKTDRLIPNYNWVTESSNMTYQKPTINWLD